MAYDDPIEAARRRMMPTGQSFFPAVQRLFDDRSDLNSMLNQTPETAYLGTPPATPTPTPTPAPRSYFGFQGFQPRLQNNPQFNIPTTTGLQQFVPPTATPTPVKPSNINLAQLILPSRHELDNLSAQYGWNT